MSAVQRAIERFSDHFHRRPRWIASAPGRVNLIGEHTDYNDGFVLPMAIESRTAAAADLGTERLLTLHSAVFGETVRFDLTHPLTPRPRHWSNHAAGVIAGMRESGIDVPGLDVIVESDVPVGAGLSSSAALEVAVATLVEAVTGTSLDPKAKARLCQRAEREFAGVPTGIMDQFVAVLARPGHAVRIDCRSLEAEYVELSDPAVSVMIVNTNVHHDLADGAYANRRSACVEAARRLGVPALRDATMERVEQHASALGPELLARARHVVSENARVDAAVDACVRRDWDEAGALMYASHVSLRDDYQVSCLELDVLVEASRDIGRADGVFGCRMTGGGFGGSVVCLVRSESAAGIAGRMRELYADRTGRRATVMISRPGGGAYTSSIP
jgi:galactokinase